MSYRCNQKVLRAHRYQLYVSGPGETESEWAENLADSESSPVIWWKQLICQAHQLHSSTINNLECPQKNSELSDTNAVNECERTKYRNKLLRFAVLDLKIEKKELKLLHWNSNTMADGHYDKDVRQYMEFQDEKQRRFQEFWQFCVRGEHKLIHKPSLL